MELTYFNIIGANEENFFRIRSYLNNYEDIRVDMTYRFENVVRQRDEIWLVRRSVVAFTKKIENVPVIFHTKLLPEEEPPEGATRLLCDALKSLHLSTIVGKIIQVCFGCTILPTNLRF